MLLAQREKWSSTSVTIIPSNGSSVSHGSVCSKVKQGAKKNLLLNADCSTGCQL